jgi:hypothetical protein
MSYIGICSMIKSDSKVLPKVDDVDAGKTVEQVVNTDSSTNFAKAI